MGVVCFGVFPNRLNESGFFIFCQTFCSLMNIAQGQAAQVVPLDLFFECVELGIFNLNRTSVRCAKVKTGEFADIRDHLNLLFKDIFSFVEFFGQKNGNQQLKDRINQFTTSFNDVLFTDAKDVMIAATSEQMLIVKRLLELILEYREQFLTTFDAGFLGLRSLVLNNDLEFLNEYKDR